MHRQQSALREQFQVRSFPGIFVVENVKPSQQDLDIIELRRIVQFMIYAIKEISCAHEQPLKILRALATGEEISPGLTGELRADLKTCARERLSEASHALCAHFECMDIGGES